MKRVVFLPDRPVDREGDLFRGLVAELGLETFEIDGEPEGADFIAFIGRERAQEQFGRRLKTGPVEERWHGAEVYVLPSTAPEHRARFFEGVWRSFAARVLDRDLAVRDEFKGMRPEEIRRRLDSRRFDFAVLIANVVYDFNLGSIIRTANAFLAREVLVYGRRKTDLRGAMGSYIYENMVHIPDLAALDRHVSRHSQSLVCLEQVRGAVPLAEFEWPEFPVMILGQEGPGVPRELRERADHHVEIPQHGSIRSLNAGVAAGIAMYDWHAKHRFRPGNADD